MRHPASIIASLFAALSVTACADSTGPAPGIVRIAVVTEGGDQDEDGYVVVISGRRLSLSRNSSHLVDDVEAGTHTLSLEGVADNCTLRGEPTRSIAIQSGAVTEVLFQVQCDATGVEITTLTSGLDQPDGAYLVTSGERTGHVAANGKGVISRLQPGSRLVSLSGVPSNCRIASENPVVIAVVLRTITPVAFEIACTPIDKHIVFVEYGNAFGQPNTSVQAADASGSRTVALSRGDGPAWSPDGTRIVYSDTMCDYYYYSPCTGGLTLLHPDTRESMPLDGTGLGVDPAWSPDGNVIAFGKVSASFYDFVTLNVLTLGGSLLEIGTEGWSARNPSWSPDGQRIAFGCSSRQFRFQTDFEICLINRNGTGFTRLTTDSAIDGNPAWSPDGKTIAFETNRFSSGRTDIALMTPGETSITLVTHGTDPAWLPDGSRLVFARYNGLFSVGADGSDVRRITTGSHRDPAWRPR